MKIINIVVSMTAFAAYAYAQQDFDLDDDDELDEYELGELQDEIDMERLAAEARDIAYEDDDEEYSDEEEGTPHGRNLKKKKKKCTEVATGIDFDCWFRSDNFR